MTGRRTGRVLGAVVAVALLGGCGAMNEMSRADADRAAALEGRIAAAEGMDARECAPGELARAQALVEHARHEAMEWHSAAEVDEEFRAAEQAVVLLQARTKQCRDAKQLAARAVADADHDGVPDIKDSCPGTPSGTPVDAVGCPLDSDGDGVVDARDKCPDTPRGAPVDVSGCLADRDGDGLTDWDETQKYGTDPNNPDTDGDGLKDGAEIATFGTNPTVADTDGGSVGDGLEVLVEKTNPLDPADDVKEVVCVELQIEFDFNSAVVKPEYFPEVERIAGYLRQFRSLRVEIQGHTDGVGNPDYNMALSLRRANSVIALLADRYGIARGRLSAKGFGATEPIASNHTAAGRARNRRIYALLECK